MTPTALFYILIAIIVFSFIFDKILDVLNTKRFDDAIPSELSDVYAIEEYKKSQAYKKETAKFSSITALFSLLLTLGFFFFDGFKMVDTFAKGFTESTILISLIFFGVIMIGADILTTPFSYYRTFVIEEKFGFNKTTKLTFLADKIKGLLMTVVIGGGVLALIVWLYLQDKTNFWLYAWFTVTVFMLFMNLFYSKLIVPLFNKQAPLDDGGLKTAIENYADKVDFKLDNIYVINGSKRSTKANAYFSGFGSQKRITLYDTLINDLETDEVVAVLAHEVGHYKRKHVIFNLASSIILTGITFFILSLFVGSPLLSKSLGVATPCFHIGLIAFGILYSPISEMKGLLMNIVSRKFEYQADNFAKETYNEEALISSLKKLSKNSLSNLTPHPAYVFVHYSHPTLLERVQNLKLP